MQTIRIIGVVCAVGFLTACSGSRWVHPTKPESEFTAEYNRCENLILRDPKLQQGNQLLIVNATERCMQKEGWRLVEDE
jgi:hypothetical protein